MEILATEVGLSWVHLYRKMKSLTGESPKAYINKVRLQKAYQLLEHGNHKPAEVAVMVGYYDVKYFGKSFKKFFGESPSQVSLTTVG